jgi:hypothetical protein
LEANAINPTIMNDKAKIDELLKSAEEGPEDIEAK